MVAGALCAGLLLMGCSNTAPDGAASAATAEVGGGGQGPSSAATFGEGDGLAIGGTGLPENWPEAVPSYPDGSVLSAAVLDGGATINASWATSDSAEAAWQTVDGSLRDRGFLPVGELGQESQFLQDETQTTDTYRNDSYEVNVVVVAGEQTTVLLNASRLS